MTSNFYRNNILNQTNYEKKDISNVKRSKAIRSEQLAIETHTEPLMR